MLARTPVFETGSFSHSDTSPGRQGNRLYRCRRRIAKNDLVDRSNPVDFINLLFGLAIAAVCRGLVASVDCCGCDGSLVIFGVFSVVRVVVIGIGGLAGLVSIVRGCLGCGGDRRAGDERCGQWRVCVLFRVV